MKVTMTKVLLGALAMFVAGAAQAQNVQLVSHTMFAELEQEVAYTNSELSELKARLASLEEGDMAPLQKGGKGAVNCCDCWCNPCPGWTGSAEILLLRPHDSEPDSTTSNQYQTGSRFTVGYIDNCGRSWRARYFEFYHDNWDGNSLTLEMADLEYAGRFRLGCNWYGEIGAGVRWAEFHDNSNDYTETIGPVVGVELRNQLRCDVDIYALYRRSLQFGEEGTDDSGMFGISELQVGAEITRCIAGRDMFARVALEAQEWSGIEDNDSEDLGLIGLGFAVGLAR